MGNSDDHEQRSDDGTLAASNGAQGGTEVLAVAREFLQDDEVKHASRGKKAEYLRSKGLEKDTITKLLDEAAAAHVETADAQQVLQSESNPSAEILSAEPQSQPQNDGPPVITYPEFLTKPSRPPPLVTANALLNTLYAFAGVSTLLYGTSKYVVAPMVENLTEARSELQQTTSDKLSAMVQRLEGIVSEIPMAASKPKPYSDTESTVSDAEDPTELFHRDVGVQTSLPPSPDPTKSATSAKDDGFDSGPIATQHTKKLDSLTSSLKELQTSYTSQSEDLADVKTVMDVFKDDLGTLTFPGPGVDFVGGYSLYGTTKKNEPDDEIKKARDNIRRIKGVMLSTRNFPGAAR